MRSSNILPLNSARGVSGGGGNSGARGYSSPTRVARMGTSPRNDIAPRPPPQAGGSSSDYATPRRHDPSSSENGSGGGGSILPVLTPPAVQVQVPPLRTPSPNAFKRAVWTTPRSPHESSGSPSSLNANANSYGLQTPPRRNSRSYEDDQQYAYGLDEDSEGGYPAYYPGDGDDISYMLNPISSGQVSDSPSSSSSSLHLRLQRGGSRGIENPDKQKHSDDAAQLEQLAYMEQMYNTIQVLNAELEKERQDRNARLAAASSSIDDEVSVALEYPVSRGSGGHHHHHHHHQYPANASDFCDDPSTSLLVESTLSASSGSRRSRPLLSQPKRPVPPPPSSQNSRTLSKDQVELCATLGKNAELHIRTKEMEKSVEKASVQLDQAQKQMKMVERRISNREEKLRILMKEKLHWQKELKDMRDQVVEEKMRQVELFRRLEIAKRENAAQMKQLEHDLREIHDENQSLRAQVAEGRAHITFQAKKLDEVMRQAREEEEKLASCIAETRYKFKEWKEGEAAALRSSREQAVNSVKTEYDLKIARHQEEKQKLREKVKDLEVSLRLMQKDRTLSPLELSLRKATILGSKDTAGTSEAELIEAHSRIRELEALMEHSQKYQKRQENIIKVSEATISRLVQEREVTALENLSVQPLAGGLTSPMFATDGINMFASSMPNYLVSSSSPNIGVQRDTSKRQSYGSVKSPLSHDNSSSSSPYGKPRASSSTTNRIQPASSSPLPNAPYRNDPGLTAQPPPQASSASTSSFSLMTSSPSKLSKTSAVEPTQVERERNSEPRGNSPRRQYTGIHGIHAVDAKNRPPELAPPDPIDEDGDGEGATSLSDEAKDTSDAHEQPSYPSTSTPSPAVSSKEQFLASEVARLQKEFVELKASTTSNQVKSEDSTPSAPDEPNSIADDAALDADESAEDDVVAADPEAAVFDESALSHQHGILEETKEELENGYNRESAENKSHTSEVSVDKTESINADTKRSDAKEDPDAAVHETRDDQEMLSESRVPHVVDEVIETIQPDVIADDEVGPVSVSENTSAVDIARSQEDELPTHEDSIDDASVSQKEDESSLNSPAASECVSSGQDESSTEDRVHESDALEELVAVTDADIPSTTPRGMDKTLEVDDSIVQSRGRLAIPEDVLTTEDMDTTSTSVVCDVSSVLADDFANVDINEVIAMEMDTPDSRETEAKEPDDHVNVVNDAASDEKAGEIVASTGEEASGDPKVICLSGSESSSAVVTADLRDSKDVGGDDDREVGENGERDEAEAKTVCEEEGCEQPKSSEEKEAKRGEGSGEDNEEKLKSSADFTSADAPPEDKSVAGDPEVSTLGSEDKELTVKADDSKAKLDVSECEETKETSTSECSEDSVALSIVVPEECDLEAKEELIPVHLVSEMAGDEETKSEAEESNCEETSDAKDSIVNDGGADDSVAAKDPSDGCGENEESAQSEAKVVREEHSDQSEGQEVKGTMDEDGRSGDDEDKHQPIGNDAVPNAESVINGANVSALGSDDKEPSGEEDDSNAIDYVQDQQPGVANDPSVSESVEVSGVANEDDEGLSRATVSSEIEVEGKAADPASNGDSVNAVELSADIVEVVAEPEQIPEAATHNRLNNSLAENNVTVEPEGPAEDVDVSLAADAVVELASETNRDTVTEVCESALGVSASSAGEGEGAVADSANDGDSVQAPDELSVDTGEFEQIAEAAIVAEPSNPSKETERASAPEPEALSGDEVTATSAADTATVQLSGPNQEAAAGASGESLVAVGASVASESTVGTASVPETECDDVSDPPPDRSSSDEGAGVSLLDNSESEASSESTEADEIIKALCLPPKSSADATTTLFFNNGEQFHCDTEEQQQQSDPADPPPCEKLSVEGLVASSMVAKVVRKGLHHSIVLHLEIKKYVAKTFVLSIFQGAIQSTVEQRDFLDVPEGLDGPEEQRPLEVLKNEVSGQDVEANAGSECIEGEVNEPSLTEQEDSVAAHQSSEVDDSPEEGSGQEGADHEHVDSRAPDSEPPLNDQDTSTDNPSSSEPANGDSGAQHVCLDNEGDQVIQHQEVEQEPSFSQDLLDSTVNNSAATSDPQDQFVQAHGEENEEREIASVSTCSSDQVLEETVDAETLLVESAEVGANTDVDRDESSVIDLENERTTAPNPPETKTFAEEFVLNVQNEAVVLVLADQCPHLEDSTVHSDESDAPTAVNPKEPSIGSAAESALHVTVEAALLVPNRDDQCCKDSSDSSTLDSEVNAAALLAENSTNALLSQNSESGLLPGTDKVDSTPDFTPGSVSEVQTTSSELPEQQERQGDDTSKSSRADEEEIVPAEDFVLPVALSTDDPESLAVNSCVARPETPAKPEFSAVDFVTAVEAEAIAFVTKSVMLEQQMRLDADGGCVEMPNGGDDKMSENRNLDAVSLADEKKSGVLDGEEHCDSTTSENPELNQMSTISAEADRSVSASELVSSDSAAAQPTLENPDVSESEVSEPCKTSVVSAQAVEQVIGDAIASVDGLCHAVEADVESSAELNDPEARLDTEDSTSASGIDGRIEAGNCVAELEEPRESDVKKLDADCVNVEAAIATEVRHSVAELAEACEGEDVKKSDADVMAVETAPSVAEQEACLVAEVARISLKLSFEIAASALEAYSAAWTTNGVDTAVVNDDIEGSTQEVPVTCENDVSQDGTEQTEDTESPLSTNVEAESECATEEEETIDPPANDVGGKEHSSEYQTEGPSEEQTKADTTIQLEHNADDSRYNSVVRPNSPHEEVYTDESAVQHALQGVAGRLSIIQASRANLLDDVSCEDPSTTTPAQADTVEVPQDEGLETIDVGDPDCCEQVLSEPAEIPAGVLDANTESDTTLVPASDCVQGASSAIEDPDASASLPATTEPDDPFAQGSEVVASSAEVEFEDSDSTLSGNSPPSSDGQSTENEPVSASLPQVSTDPDCGDPPVLSNEAASAHAPEVANAESLNEPTEEIANDGDSNATVSTHAAPEKESTEPAAQNAEPEAASDTPQEPETPTVETSMEAIDHPVVDPPPSEETGNVESESAQNDQPRGLDSDATGETADVSEPAVESTGEVEFASPVPDTLTSEDLQTVDIEISVSVSADGKDSEAELVTTPVDDAQGVQDAGLLNGGASTNELDAEAQSETDGATSEQSLGSNVWETESTPAEPEPTVTDPPEEMVESGSVASLSNNGIELDSASALEGPADESKNEAIVNPTSEVDTTGATVESESITIEDPNASDETTERHHTAVVSDAEANTTLSSNASAADAGACATGIKTQEAKSSTPDNHADDNDILVTLNGILDEIERTCATTSQADTVPESPPEKAVSKVTWDLPLESERDTTTPSPPPKSRRTERRRTSRRLLEQSRYTSSSEMMCDPTLAAYDAHREQGQPFALLDDNIFSIDPHARHMQHDENDKAKSTESEIRAKRKNFDQDNHRKSIAYRSIPAFNYAPVLIHFQWSDFVVATPISMCNLTDPNDKKSWNPASPVKKMRLLAKKGIKLPCGSYVIISAFIRPLEDGNENLRIHIYDSEWVEEFQYDFFEDHLREYMHEWTGRDEEARLFMTQLEFRREEGGIIIKLPDKIGQEEARRPITAPAMAMPLPDGKEHSHHGHSSPQPPHRNLCHSHRPLTSPHAHFLPLQARSFPNLSDSSRREKRQNTDDSTATNDSDM